MGQKIFQNSRSHFQILGAIRVKEWVKKFSKTLEAISKF